MVKTYRTEGLDVYSNNSINKSTLAKAKPEAYKHVAKYGVGKHKQEVPVRLPSGKIIMRRMDVGQRENAPKNILVQKPDEEAKKDIESKAAEKRALAQRENQLKAWDNSFMHKVMKYLPSTEFEIRPSRQEMMDGKGNVYNIHIKPKSGVNVSLDMDYNGKLKLTRNYETVGSYSKAENAAKRLEEETNSQLRSIQNKNTETSNMRSTAENLSKFLKREVKVEEDYERDSNGKRRNYSELCLRMPIVGTYSGTKIGVSGDNNDIFRFKGTSLPPMNAIKLKKIIEVMES